MIAKLISCFLFCSAVLFAQTERKIIYTDKAPYPIGPYSQAIKVGHTVYLSGQIALKLNGEIDTNSIEVEMNLVLQNLRYVLEAAKLEFKNVVKSTIYLTDMKDFNKVNSIYTKHFLEIAPARETVEVKSLPKGAHVEISMVAVE
jgi:2-iminobutanoate/2-iminopropanoate deaminase